MVLSVMHVPIAANCTLEGPPLRSVALDFPQATALPSHYPPPPSSPPPCLATPALLFDLCLVLGSHFPLREEKIPPTPKNPGK